MSKIFSVAAPRTHIIIFALITALCLLGDSMLYVVLPVHYEEAGLASLWEVGIILATNRLARLPLNPCIGWFYSRFSERTGIFIATVLAVATTLSYSILPGLLFWIVARCVWGVAWTLLRLGSLFCILKLSTPENRGEYTGLYNGLYRLGSLFGMLLGGILADAIGFATTAVIFGGVSALSVIAVFFFIPRGEPSRHDASSAESVFTSLKLAAQDPKTLWTVAAGGFIAFSTQGVATSTLSHLIAEHTNGGVTLIATFIGAASLSGFFQALRWLWEPWLSPFIGRVSDTRYGRSSMLCVAFGLGIVMFALLALPLPVPLWFVCLLGMLLTATLLTTLIEASASDLASLSGGRVLLMAYALTTDVGAALGPLMAYSLNEIMGINAVYAVNALLFMVFFIRWTAWRKAG
ncbi:MAG: MFS transporter [Desulfovibrio sp.]|nr:MFS transporter [Desulfovibrio sp.]